MKIRIVFSISFLAFLLLASTGCRKWLDINQNPNVAQDVPPNLLLSSAQIAAASAIGCDFKINGSMWAQHWTQATSSSQYKIYEQYAPSASDFDYRWRLIYSSALMDLEALEQKARATNLKEYIAVAQVMKAYIFQVATDAWGDVPFSQALKGRPQDGGIVNPKYDSQEVVYAGINRLLDSARNTIENLTSFNVEGDLIFNGDKELWRKFTNTLQLKVYLRLSEVVEATAQAGVAKVYAAAGGASGFLERGESALINYNSTPGNQNPLYAEMNGLRQVQNLVASKTVVDEMNANFDFRAWILFTALGNGVVGIPQGAYNLPASTPVSIPTAYTGARAQDPASANAAVRFLSDYESLFLQSEAAARGWISENAQDLFEEGIFASFHHFTKEIADYDIILRDSFAGVPISEATIFRYNADYAAYAYIHGDTVTGYIFGDPVDLYNYPAAEWGQYPSNGPVENRVRHIITQKWFSMTGTQGFEAWTELRRTGFPDFTTVSVNSLIGNKYPVRFLYPSTELTANQNFPGQKFIYDKVWWDIK